MPNQFEPPKIVLTRQAEIPKIALSATPLAALGEGLTGVLANIAGGLPEMGAAPPAAPAALAGLFKSLEATLPAGLPKMYGGGGKVTTPTPGGVLTTEVAPAPMKAPALIFE